MSELSSEKDTSTAKSSAELSDAVQLEISARLHWLQTSLRTAGDELTRLTDELVHDGLTTEERSELRQLEAGCYRARQRVTELEDKWRARQGLSPRS